MNRVTQVILARRTLAFKLAYAGWLHEQSYSTAVAVLRSTAPLCRELAHTLHALASFDGADMMPYYEELVTTTTLLSAMADTAYDPDATAQFAPSHTLSLPAGFPDRLEPLTPRNVSIDAQQEEVPLLESYCERMAIDRPRAFTLLRAFCRVSAEFAAEIYRLAPTKYDAHAAEVAVTAQTALRTCFKFG